MGQEKFLARNFDASRFVWNQLVAGFNSWNTMGPNPQVTEKRLKDTPEYSFLNDAISYVLQQKRMDFVELKKQFFNAKRKKKLGRPNFKKKSGRQSFKIPAPAIPVKSLTDLHKGILLPKCKSRIKIAVDRLISEDAVVKSLTVSRETNGQFYVSILVEEVIAPLPLSYKSVGIDLGLIDLITTSDGIKVKNPKFFRKNQAKLASAQRHLSRKKKGSNQYNKQKQKVALLHKQIANIRNWLHHNISTALVRDYDHIFMEDLNIAGMKQNRCLAKSVSDASMSSLVFMIEYKCNWYGKTFHKVDRWFASSKTCNSCGHKLDELPLSIRGWDCPQCGSHHDRDENAAKNILDRGFLDLYELNSVESTEYRRREELSRDQLADLASSMKRLANSVHFIDLYSNA